MEKFDGMIGAKNLLGLVKNTAPFLFDPSVIEAPSLSGRWIERADHPLGWLSILLSIEAQPPNEAAPSQEEREDYFALCIACHHATVGTFVPTDVDTKIRGILWNETSNPDSLRRMFSFTQKARLWDASKVTTRFAGATLRLSGHNGEWLSVLAGALGAALRVKDDALSEEVASAIEEELQFEARAFEETQATKDKEPELLKLAALLTHNVGDLDQGISFWKKSPEHKKYKERFGRLAHENTTPYRGVFQRSAHLYKKIMSPEGHRNYPLREVRFLRDSPDFLLPLSPFLDDWGAKLGGHSAISRRDLSSLVGALLLGCKKIPGQVGYFRALSGIAEAQGGRFEALLQDIPSALRQEAKNPEVKKQLGIKKISFESSMKKRAQQALAEISR